MPIHLVRWPELSASLVRAQDEEDLLDILDQVANSESCEWSIYEGPLFIDFRLPVEWTVRNEQPEQPIRPEQVVVGEIGSLEDGVLQALEASISDGDDGWEMGTEIVSRAFPKLQAVIDKFHDSGNVEETDGALPEAELRKALHAELVRVVRSSWRQAQLRNKQDPVSELARQMDLPVALAQKYVDAAKALETDEGDTADTGLEGFATSDSLFTVSNHHTAACGRPPDIDADAQDAYYGYFANEHGEQAVYTYDHTTGEATVRMGDVGWQNTYRVVDGRIEGVKVSKAEEAWLKACWIASARLGKRHGFGSSEQTRRPPSR